ncbi:hypothetical protein OKA05_02230 [Luteolibacter arcticus]|uniref:PEP-CTERM protein-sorting domain-containing protein n=1 Tax=Luteolibacter arcticus TaxID=1581411 RepID=A0ABT3GD36_9BACT|nr:hypothetical protein [Luteolibacter arcticus]MCW1921351.1 hypothetical protein [Luteolibacter arcticus]
MNFPTSYRSAATCSLAAIALLTTPGNAALVVTNGGFGTNSVNAQYIDDASAGAQNDPAWFESTASTNWIEGSWTNSDSTTFPSGTGPALLFDGGSATMGWTYQSLGTVTATEISLGTLRIFSDFAEKTDGASNGARFDIFTGNFSAADGTDVLGAGGITSLGTITLNASDQGLTAAAGNASRQSNVFVGNIDISGLSIGDQVWLRIAESRDTAFTSGDLIVDNVSIAVVPESSIALLGAFGVLGLLRRRR